MIIYILYLYSYFIVILLFSSTGKCICLPSHARSPLYLSRPFGLSPSPISLYIPQGLPLSLCHPLFLSLPVSLYLSLSLSLFLYIYIYIYSCKFIYIYIHISGLFCHCLSASLPLPVCNFVTHSCAI